MNELGNQNLPLLLLDDDCNSNRVPAQSTTLASCTRLPPRYGAAAFDAGEGVV